MEVQQGGCVSGTEADVIRIVGIVLVVVCLPLMAYVMRDKPHVRIFIGYDNAGRPVFDEPCCEPDYDLARGGYIHADWCQGDPDGY